MRTIIYHGSRESATTPQMILDARRSRFDKWRDEIEGERKKERGGESKLTESRIKVARGREAGAVFVGIINKLITGTSFFYGSPERRWLIVWPFIRPAIYELYIPRVWHFNKCCLLVVIMFFFLFFCLLALRSWLMSLSGYWTSMVNGKGEYWIVKMIGSFLVFWSFLL